MSAPQPNEAMHPNERINLPSWKRLILQGRNRLMLMVHKQTEQYHYVGEKKLIIPNRDDCQDIASTGQIIRMTELDPDMVKYYGDVQVGAHVQVTPCTWTTFKCAEGTVATCTLDCVEGVYEWRGKTDDEALEEEAVEQRKAMEALKTEQTTASSSTTPLPSIIRVK